MGMIRKIVKSDKFKFLVLFSLVVTLSFIWTVGIRGEGHKGLLTDVVVGCNISSIQAVSMAGVANSTLDICRWCMPDDPDTYNFGNLAPGGIGETGLAYFTVENYGEGAIDVSIRATDMTGVGTDWDLSDTATAGADTYGLYAGVSGDAYNIVVRETSPYNNLIAGLATSGSQDWGLQIQAPTSMSDFNAKSGNVTLTASIP